MQPLLTDGNTTSNKVSMPFVIQKFLSEDLLKEIRVGNPDRIANCVAALNILLRRQLKNDLQFRKDLHAVYQMNGAQLLEFNDLPPQPGIIANRPDFKQVQQHIAHLRLLMDSADRRGTFGDESVTEIVKPSIPTHFLKNL